MFDKDKMIENLGDHLNFKIDEITKLDEENLLLRNKLKEF